MVGDDQPEPLIVDGMPVTASAELPPEAYDLTDYKPIREPVTKYRRFGRGRQQAVDGEAQHAVDQRAPSWAEDLRRQLMKPGHPKKSVLDVRCDGRDRHRLLWLVESPWGLVPITHTADEPEDADPEPALTWSPLGGNPILRKSTRPKSGRFTSHFHGLDLEPGRPLTLGEWPVDQPFPLASCPCYAEAEFTLDDVRKRLASRNETYRRSGPTV